MELERVRGQRDVEAARQVVRQRGPVVVQEERVVGQRPGIIFSQTAATSRYRSGRGGRVSTGILAVHRRDSPSQLSTLQPVLTMTKPGSFKGRRPLKFFGLDLSKTKDGADIVCI